LGKLHVFSVEAALAEENETVSQADAGSPSPQERSDSAAGPSQGSTESNEKE
jgi:hypothetical protein